MLTSCVPDEDVVVKRRGKDSMGGVDRSDQMMSSYPMERKRLKKWSNKMWLHLINTCVFNAHILHKKPEGNSPLEFRLTLISQLVKKYGYDTEAVRKGGRPSTGGNLFGLVEQHFPSYVPATEKNSNATRRCVVRKKHGTRKESRYECLCCAVGLFAAPCFGTYHTLKVF